MKKIKGFLRLLGLTVLIILAMCGVGFFGALFPNRERLDKAVTVERKDDNETEADESSSQE
jgi:hypothetical protein